MSTVPAPNDEARQLYVCENCSRLGPMSSFQDECRPGWTHGRLIPVDASCLLAKARAERAAEIVAWLRAAGPAAGGSQEDRERIADLIVDRFEEVGDVTA